jgi:hypothetical protein
MGLRQAVNLGGWRFIIMLKKIKSFLQDVFALLAFAAFIYGIYLIYIPAAWIVGGAGVLWFFAGPGRRNR